MIKRYAFDAQDHGKLLTQLGYEQIDSDARFIFDRPIVITQHTLIEHDARRGTFSLVSSSGRRTQIVGKWDR